MQVAKLTSYQELAAYLGESGKVISAWKSRNSSAAVRKIKEVCGSLEELPWILDGGVENKKNAPGHDANTGPAPPPSGRVPVISWVQAGGWTEIIDNFQPGDADEWVSTTKRVGRAAFALRVSGTSMEPDFREGDLIIVDPDTEAVSGSLVVARLNGNGEATFKKFVRDGGKVYLEPLNSRYQPIDITGKDVTICGVVRQVIRDV